MNKDKPGAAWLLRADAPPCRMSPRDFESLIYFDEEDGWVPRFAELYKLMDCDTVEIVFHERVFKGELYADERGAFMANPQINVCASALNALEYEVDAPIVGHCVFIPHASVDTAFKYAMEEFEARMERLRTIDAELEHIIEKLEEQQEARKR